MMQDEKVHGEKMGVAGEGTWEKSTLVNLQLLCLTQFYRSFFEIIAL
jgi:hypothetical protein